MKKAVIVCAGLSSRLYPLTLEEPKGLLKVGGLSMLDRSIDVLHESGITDVALVVGYCKNKIIDALGNKVSYIENPFYKQCNNM